MNPPARKQLSVRQAKLWAGASRRTYSGLLLGAALGLAILPAAPDFEI